MSLAVPFQGQIWFQEETTYGTIPSSVSMRISDKVLDVRIDTGDVTKALRGISEPSVCAFISQPSDPTLHVEWVLQPATAISLASYCIARDTWGDLKSLTFTVGAGTWGVSNSWWQIAGCKAKNIKLSGSRGNEYVCTADFSVKSIASCGSGIGLTKPAALGTAYAVFNNAGSITWMGSTTRFFVTDSFEVTLDNNLKDYWDCDSLSKVSAVAGAKGVTGTSDISLEDGGAGWLGLVNGNTDFGTATIVLATNAAGLDDTWTVTGVKFPSTSIDINISGDAMMTSQPFIAKTLSVS